MCVIQWSAHFRRRGSYMETYCPPTWWAWTVAACDVLILLESTTQMLHLLRPTGILKRLMPLSISPCSFCCFESLKNIQHHVNYDDPYARLGCSLNTNTSVYFKVFVIYNQTTSRLNKLNPWLRKNDWCAGFISCLPGPNFIKLLSTIINTDKFC